MSRESISMEVQRKLYAESMGRCMNPKCEIDILGSDIGEKAHIIPYCKTKNNAFENLVLLCPNCHTKYDKSNEFSPEEILSWKMKRRQEISEMFEKKFETFLELESVVRPILEENRAIYMNYYLGDNHMLWEKFEEKILFNNNKLKLLLKKNLNLFQSHKEPRYSNSEIINDFILHIEEFAMTRGSKEKIREVLFPQAVNSIFGIECLNDMMLPSVESLESLIEKLIKEEKFIDLQLGEEEPHFKYLNNGNEEIVFLKDTARVRQLYHDYNCFKNVNLRLESLNFTIKYLKSRGILYEFSKFPKLSEIIINGRKIKFIYKYCLSRVELQSMMCDENLLVVNLHNWNGEGCISGEAHQYSKLIGVELMTLNEFYKNYSRRKSD